MRDNDGNDQDTLTLRDRFAMAALPVVLKVNGWKGDSAEGTVAQAYHFANAMLVVRAAIPYPDGQVETAPTRTAEQERADVLALIAHRRRQLEIEGGSRDTENELLALQCDVENGVHVGAVERAKGGAK